MGLLHDALESGICPSCQKKKNTIEEQYSFGYYAGVMCRDCAISKFADGCGLNQPMGNARELDDCGDDYDAEGDWR